MVTVEIILVKGTGVALSALGKTKAGVEFLARLEKLADKTGELANLGKLKIAEQFSDEAALFASNRLRQRLAATQLYAGIPADTPANFGDCFSKIKKPCDLSNDHRVFFG